MLDTMADVITEYFFFDPSKRRSDSRDLRDNVDAVPVLLHHSGDPSNLAFNPGEVFRARSLDVVSHGGYIYPYRVPDTILGKGKFNGCHGAQVGFI